MIDIGAQIKQARIEKKLSLEEISNRLRINVAYLADIERGKFDFLPKPYVVAFTKIFANFVGLNGEEVAKSLREPAASTSLPAPVSTAPESHWLEQPAAPPPPRQIGPYETSPDVFKRLPYLREIAISLGIILAIALLLYFVSRPGEEASENQSFEAATEGSSSQAAAPEVTLEQMVQQAQEYAKPDSSLEPTGLTLEARINAQVWVRLIADGADTTEATYPAGSVQTWQAKENFKLRAGNISALSLTLNGKRLENLGPNGRPANVTITREGVVPERPRSPGRPRRAAADTARR